MNDKNASGPGTDDDGYKCTDISTPRQDENNQSKSEAVQIEMLRQIKELKEQVNDLKTMLDYSVGMAPPPAVEESSAEKPVKGRRLKKRESSGWLKEMLFYALLFVIVICAFFIRSNAEGRPVLIGGFSAFIVETGSMQAEIPKGSLVVTRQVDPETLKVGDDITFMANPTTTITHRIIGITEKFDKTGQRAFETQGIMNKAPDKNPVPAANVVGKVVWHSEPVGLMAAFIGTHWPVILFVLVVIAGLFFVLKKINSSDDGSHGNTARKNF